MSTTTTPPTQPTPTTPEPNWGKRLKTFAAMHAPFTTRWDQYRAYHNNIEGLLEVHTPGDYLTRPTIIPIEEKPTCACCGSPRPMFFRILTDRNGAKHMVGQECYAALCALNHVTHLEEPARPAKRLCRDCVHWVTTANWQGKCTVYKDKGRWSQSAQPYDNCTRYTPTR